MAEDTSGWITVRVEVAAPVADAVANFLVEEGAPGLVTGEAGTAEPGRTRLEAPLRAGEQARVTASLVRYLASLADIVPAARHASIETVPLAVIDWSALARAHHRPVTVGRRLLVVPPWEIPAASGREVLVIEPGMAFGTGQHATTRGCLEAIETAVLAGGVASALDVGTGSGVLALALARLGVPRVIALDTDPAALPVARRNRERNAAAHVSLLAGPLGAVRGTFDLVVANLLADTLVAAASELAAAVAPRGRLVLSGLLEAQRGTVRAAYAAWRVASTWSADGWSTLTLLRGV